MMEKKQPKRKEQHMPAPPGGQPWLATEQILQFSKEKD